jgi:hypothetical protein
MTSRTRVSIAWSGTEIPVVRTREYQKQAVRIREGRLKSLTSHERMKRSIGRDDEER